MEQVKEGAMKDYLMERRRILRDEVASIERQLGIDSKEKTLERRIAELERRLLANPPASMLR